MTLTKTLTLALLVLTASTIFGQDSDPTKWAFSHYEQGLEKTRVNRASVFSQEDKQPELTRNVNNAVVGLAIFNNPAASESWTAAFVISGEQFDCVRGCTVRFKLDDGEIQSMTAKERDYKGLWLSDGPSFVRKLKGASTMEIEIPLWRRGSIVFKMRVADFPYERMFEK